MPISLEYKGLSSFELLASSCSAGRILVKENGTKIGYKGIHEKTDYDANVETMKCFKKALREKYGIFGENAFDTVLSDRFLAKQGLRGKDVNATIAKVDKMRMVRIHAEVVRQVVCSPLMAGRDAFNDENIRKTIGCNVEKRVLAECKKTGVVESEAKLAQIVMKALAKELGKEEWNDVLESDTKSKSLLPGAWAVKAETLPKAVNTTDAVGLRNLPAKPQLTSRNGGLLLENGQDGVAYRVKTGRLTTGMRINNGNANPIVLRALKGKGVEPGFIYSNDWRVCDTKAMMRTAKQGEKSLAAYAEALIERYKSRPSTAIGKAIDWASRQESVPRLTQRTKKEWMAAIKALAFAAIRDEIVNPTDTEIAAQFPGVGTRFRTRYLVKLDYGGADRSKLHYGKTDSGGDFVRSARVKNFPDKKSLVFRNGKFCGFNRKFFSNHICFSTTAFEVNVGAVSEALANDLMRVTGIPSQALSLSLGKYSDGKPKFLLQAEVAENYHDLEDGDEDNKNIVKDGYLTKDAKIIDVAKWKIPLLMLGDRDAIGSHAQNKGFIRNAQGVRTFFAIDPGKTLSGRPRTVYDDFSFKRDFKDKEAGWFMNFTIFDDFKRSEKFAGVLLLADEALERKYEKIFNDYRTKINELFRNRAIDKKLCDAILERIDKMHTELFAEREHIMTVFGPQIKLYRDVIRRTGRKESAEQAIDALDLVEKLSSPTSTRSSDSADATDLEYRRILPGKRVRWTAQFDTLGNLQLKATTKLTAETYRDVKNGLSRCGASKFAWFKRELDGTVSIKVTNANLEKFLEKINEKAAFGEEKAK